jgi:hypothetical protein
LIVDAPEIWRYTCTHCGILVRTEGRSTGVQIAACGCGAPIDEELEPQTEAGA